MKLKDLMKALQDAGIKPDDEIDHIDLIGTDQPINVVRNEEPADEEGPSYVHFYAEN